MKLVLFVEEPSMKEVLDVLLPKIVPEDVMFQVVTFSGRGDLESGIVRKLRYWNEPDVRFVIVEDQDDADCRQRKANLECKVAESGKPALVRIVCRELEAWYFGDLDAVGRAYEMPDISKKFSGKKGYRNPDAIVDVKQRFKTLVPEHQQITGARRIAPHMVIEKNRSGSFQAFVSGVQNLCE